MDPRIPAVLVPTFEHYLSLVHQRLPGFLNAFYLVGSIALDEFNQHFSDLDFVVVSNRPSTKNEAEILREIHREVEKGHPQIYHPDFE